MPATTGIELCGIIRSTPGYGDVPIIMLTAMTERRFLQDAFSAGASDYITKPFELEDIRARFSRENLLRHRRRRLADTLSASGGGQSGQTREVIRALEDAATITGVERCVQRDAFQNFILHTNRIGGAPLSIRAIKIAGVYDLFRKLPQGDYQKIVREIARLVSDQTRGSRDVITHLGNGILVSACSGKSKLDRNALSRRLEDSPHFEVLQQYDLDLKLIIGDELSLKGASNADVIFLVSRAIEAAEKAEEEASGWGSFREWFAFRKSTGQERSRLDRSAYEQILNEFVREGELGWK
jgi:hypothetical protein